MRLKFKMKSKLLYATLILVLRAGLWFGTSLPAAGREVRKIIADMECEFMFDL